MTKKKDQALKPKPAGRQSGYSESVASQICSRIAEGESLRSVCRDEAMPNKSTVLDWAASNPTFAAQYARAREVGLEVLADSILEIADDGRNDTYTDDKGNTVVDNDVIQRSKLRVDARKWLLSKQLPKKYGDRLQVEGTEGAPPIRFEIVKTTRVAEKPE